MFPTLSADIFNLFLCMLDEQKCSFFHPSLFSEPLKSPKRNFIIHKNIHNCAYKCHMKALKTFLYNIPLLR